MFWFFFCKADKTTLVLKGCWKIKYNIWRFLIKYIIQSRYSVKFSLFHSSSFLSLPFFQPKCLYVNNKYMGPMRMQTAIFILILLFLVTSHWIKCSSQIIRPDILIYHLEILKLFYMHIFDFNANIPSENFCWIKFVLNRTYAKDPCNRV